jgi:DNA-binding response OmpR family regulator
MRDLTTAPGPDMISTFLGARLGLAGFGEDESSSISSLLSGFGSLTHCLPVQSYAPASEGPTTQLDSYSAILLDLGALAELSPGRLRIAMSQLMSGGVPLLAIGTPAEIDRFPAIQTNTNELLFRPFHGEELLVRLRRSLIRTTQMRDGSRNPGVRIVVADDDPSIVGLTSVILRGRGFNCYEAKDGRQALELARTLLPDLLVLDVNMPFINGFDVLSALRADASTSARKILLFTAVDAAGSVIKGSELGADGYLCKPFRPGDFLNHVKLLLPGLHPILYSEVESGAGRPVPIFPFHPFRLHPVHA